MFHVHDDGLNSSDFDLESNKKTHLLDLVVSAKVNYKETGVKLHLVYAGNYNTIYKGPLKLLKEPIDH